MNFAHLLLLTDAQQAEKGDFADSPQRKVGPPAALAGRAALLPESTRRRR